MPRMGLWDRQARMGASCWPISQSDSHGLGRGSIRFWVHEQAGGVPSLTLLAPRLMGSPYCVRPLGSGVLIRKESVVPQFLEASVPEQPTSLSQIGSPGTLLPVEVSMMRGPARTEPLRAGPLRFRVRMTCLWLPLLCGPQSVPLFPSLPQTHPTSRGRTHRALEGPRHKGLPVCLTQPARAPENIPQPGRLASLNSHSPDPGGPTHCGAMPRWARTPPPAM